MPDLDHARSLLEMARKDLRALEILCANSDADDEVLGYHAQQAVEKAAKAWLCPGDVVHPRTHDIRVLPAQLSDLGLELPDRAEQLIDLTDFAVQYRYQAVIVDEPVDRAGTLGRVREFVEHVVNRPGEAERAG